MSTSSIREHLGSFAAQSLYPLEGDSESKDYRNELKIEGASTEFDGWVLNH